MRLNHGWATLFGSQATLEPILIYAGQFKYQVDLFDLTFYRKRDLNTPFSKKKHFNKSIKYSRATLRCSAGRMLPRPGLNN